MAEEEDDLLAPPTEEELLELQQVRERKQAMKLKRQQKREECDSCGKVVYATERMQVDDLLLHKNCFRCEVCNSKLSLGTFASVNGKLYCNKDFHAMFSSGGGSYDVFGDAGFKKHTGRATAPKEVSHAHTTGGATVNQEGAMETVHLKPTPKREKVEEEAGAGGIAVTLKPTPKREKVEEEKGGGVAVNLRPTPKVEKEEAGGAVPIKNQVALKKAPKVEKKQESSKLETVHLKSTPKVVREKISVNQSVPTVQLKPGEQPKAPVEHTALEPAGDDSSSALSLLSKLTYEKFKKLNDDTLDKQKEYFVLRFVFTLELSGVKYIESVAKEFKEKADASGQFARNAEFSLFLNRLEKKYDTAFTSKKYRDQVFNSLDLDGNGKISFLEYLMFFYKTEIIDEHYMRQGLDTPKRVNFSKAKLGKILIEELFEPPSGVDEKLDGLFQEIGRDKRTREAKMQSIREKLKTAGKVRAVGMERELRELEAQAAEEEDNVVIRAGIRRVTKKQRLEVNEIYAALNQ